MAADTVTRTIRAGGGSRAALIVADEPGVRTYSFDALENAATGLAAGLRARGIAAGDRVGIHTGSRAETAVAHLAAYKLGAIALTLSQLYGPDTLRHVLGDAAPRIIFSERQFESALREAAPGAAIVLIGQAFDTLAATDPSAFTPLATSANDPALLMYTSGSTGMPKGMLHAHRLLHAYLPTVRLFYDGRMDEPEARFWTPADWAWVGGWLDCVLPAWAHGQTVVTSTHRFEAEWALRFMARHRITHTFMTPTALKRIAEVREPRRFGDFSRLVICTGGESLPGEVMRWIETELGATCNEFYGLTEVNHLVGNAKCVFATEPGSMGRPYPGHRTTIVDEHGGELPAGEIGEIVAGDDDPTLFLGYWGAIGVPDRMRLGPWIRTGDLAFRDDAGYIRYQGRSDDLIKSAGYRIGPAEVEDSLLGHPAVAEAAVIGKPDAARGQIVKAFVRLQAGAAPSDALITELQTLVKQRLAAYKYPREIEFVDSFPLTSTGKISRRVLRERRGI